MRWSTIRFILLCKHLFTCCLVLICLVTLLVFVKLACESAFVIFTRTCQTPFWIFRATRFIYWDEERWVHLRKRVRELFLRLPLTRQPLTRNGAKNIRLLMYQFCLAIFDVTSALVSWGTSIKGKQTLEDMLRDPNIWKRLNILTKWNR